MQDAYRQAEGHDQADHVKDGIEEEGGDILLGPAESADESAPGIPELNLGQVAHDHVGPGHKGDQENAQRLVAEDQGKQPGQHQGGVDHIEQDGDLVLVEPALAEAVVQVFRVGLHEPLAGLAGVQDGGDQGAHGSAPDGQDGVEYGDADGQQGYAQGGQEGALGTGGDGDGGKREAQKHAAGIAQEDAGRVEVVAQEGHAGADQAEHDQGIRGHAADEKSAHQTQTGHQGEAGGQAV